jgi:hypothetical protein
MAVVYTEIEPSQEIIEDTTTGLWSCRRRLLCTWANRLDVINHFLYPIPGKAHDSNALATVRKATSEGFGKSDGVDGNGLLQYVEAIVTLNYSTPTYGMPQVLTYPNGSTEVASQVIEPSNEYITVDHSDLHWDSATGPSLNAAEAPSRMNLGFDYIYTRYGVSSIHPNVMNYQGSVNNGTVTAIALDISFTAEQLLYLSFSMNQRTESGVSKLDYAMRFSFRYAGWNAFWRKSKVPAPGFSHIYRSDGERYNNFPLVDFNNL